MIAAGIITFLVFIVLMQEMRVFELKGKKEYAEEQLRLAMEREKHWAKMYSEMREVAFQFRDATKELVKQIHK